MDNDWIDDSIGDPMDEFLNNQLNYLSDDTIDDPLDTTMSYFSDDTLDYNTINKVSNAQSNISNTQNNISNTQNNISNTQSNILDNPINTINKVKPKMMDLGFTGALSRGQWGKKRE